MKKVMLLIVGMLFAANVNAAALNLSTFDQDVATNATNQVIYHNSIEAVSFNSVDTAGQFTLGHHIVAAVDQWVNIEWSFNKQANFLSGDISKGGSFNLVQAVTSAGYNFNMFLLAGQNYFFDIVGISGGQPLTATLTMSAVPVPAALFLFAPALLGFFGLRRKATSALVA